MTKIPFVFKLLDFKLWKLIRDSSGRQMTVSTSVLLSETEAVTDGQCPHLHSFWPWFPLGPHPALVQYNYYFCG